MCRLIVFCGKTAVSLSDLLIKPSHSIIKQSHGCRERVGDGGSGLPAALNADGFGIGWYAPPHSTSASAPRDAAPDAGDEADAAPGLYTSTQPAWSDVNLCRLAEKVCSTLVFGHVRAASAGTGVQPLNCHPFSSGRWLFMHNGHVGAWSRMRRRILLTLTDAGLSAIKGTTDSEHLFALFLSEVERATAEQGIDPAGPLPSELIQACMLRTIQLVEQWRVELGIQEQSLINICVTDGRTTVCTRVVCGPGTAPSLYFCTGSRWAPAPASSDGGCCEYTMQHSDRRENCVIVASERLTASREDWLAVPLQSMLVVSPALTVRLLPIDLSARPQARVEAHQQPAAGGSEAAEVAAAGQGGNPGSAKRQRRMGEEGGPSTAAGVGGGGVGGVPLSALDQWPEHPAAAAAAAAVSSDGAEGSFCAPGRAGRRPDASGGGSVAAWAGDALAIGGVGHPAGPTGPALTPRLGTGASIVTAAQLGLKISIAHAAPPPNASSSDRGHAPTSGSGVASFSAAAAAGGGSYHRVQSYCGGTDFSQADHRQLDPHYSERDPLAAASGSAAHAASVARRCDAGDPGVGGEEGAVQPWEWGFGGTCGLGGAAQMPVQRTAAAAVAAGLPLKGILQRRRGSNDGGHNLGELMTEEDGSGVGAGAGHRSGGLHAAAAAAVRGYPSVAGNSSGSNTGRTPIAAAVFLHDDSFSNGTPNVFSTALLAAR